MVLVRSQLKLQPAARYSAFLRFALAAACTPLLSAGCASEEASPDDSTDPVASAEPSNVEPSNSEPSAAEPVATEPAGTGPGATEPAEPSTTPEPSGPAEPSAPLVYNACDSAAKVGGFRIDLAPNVEGVPQFTSVVGSVSDGVVPNQIAGVEAEEGECRLLKNPNLACDPPCAGSETCSADGCIPYPETHSVGAVTIDGLQIALTMMPSASRNTYSNPATPAIPHPGFEPGATLLLSAAGGDYEAFMLQGWGISPLEVANEAVQVNNAAPVAVQWVGSAADSPSRMFMSLNLDNHGVSGAAVECLTADDGEFEIPSGLATQLMGQGLSGYPSLTLRRQTVDSMELTPGCVEFVVASEIVLDVEVEGLVTCSVPEDCPEGQTCLANLSCG